jgi:hypothetical protein
VSEVGTIPLFSRIWHRFSFVDACSRHYKKQFGREKIYFLSSRKYTWRVDVFNGMLIYLWSYLSHLFPRLKENAIISVILDFHIMDPTPLPFVVIDHTVPVILFIIYSVFFILISHVSLYIVKYYICIVFVYVLFFFDFITCDDVYY